jgi:hypothetical protein
MVIKRITQFLSDGSKAYNVGVFEDGELKLSLPCIDEVSANRVQQELGILINVHTVEQAFLE